MSDLDVIVIGAGLAGLSAARQLAAAGATVQVWEASDRVGGRTHTSAIAGAAIDLGAQWLGPTQTRMHALVTELHLPTFETYAEGRAVLVDGDQRATYPHTVPLLGPLQLGRLALALRSARQQAGRVSRDPTDQLEGVEQDLASELGAWLGADGAARRLVDTAIRVIFGEEPERLSARWVAAYAAASGGDLLDLAAIRGGAQQTRLCHGTQGISVALSQGLDVRLNREVTAIDARDQEVCVTARSGERLTARFVVAALPAPKVAELALTPPLPPEVGAVRSPMRMGATTKVFATYDRPFWRMGGLRGEAVLTDGPVQVVFDNTSHDGRVPMLLGFITGRAATQAAEQPDEHVAKAFVEALTRAFGPQARHPEHIVVHHWSRQVFSGGCPVANLPPPSSGGGTGSGAELRRRHGRIHWAGTETSEVWTGYMEGAVRSGERAARELLVRL